MTHNFADGAERAVALHRREDVRREAARRVGALGGEAAGEVASAEAAHRHVSATTAPPTARVTMLTLRASRSPQTAA